MGTLAGPQHPYKKLGVAVHAYNLSTGETKMGGSWAQWPASRDYLLSLGPVSDPVSKTKVEPSDGGDAHL